MKSLAPSVFSPSGSRHRREALRLDAPKERVPALGVARLVDAPERLRQLQLAYWLLRPGGLCGERERCIGRVLEAHTGAAPGEKMRLKQSHGSLLVTGVLQRYGVRSQARAQ